MANLVQVVMQDAFRTRLMNIYQVYAGGSSIWSGLSYFRIGEGGWTNTPQGRQPVDPDKTLTNITAPSFPAPDSNYFFQKSFIAADLVAIPPQQLRVRCFVDVGEANLDNAGNPPSFFEIGIFDANNTMVAYSTFPMEVKTADKSLEHFLFLDF